MSDGGSLARDAGGLQEVSAGGPAGARGQAQGQRDEPAQVHLAYCGQVSEAAVCRLQ